MSSKLIPKKTPNYNPNNKPSTLAFARTSPWFPSIGGDGKELVEDLKKEVGRKDTKFQGEEISITGTVKLHGKHADIYIENGNNLKFKSRNKDLTLEKDLDGFAAFTTPFKAEILALRDRYYARFLELNPKVKIDDEKYAFVLAGEWIGPGIQKGVAIDKLPSKYFVIISVCTNGFWLPDHDYKDICNESIRIYNVSRSGFYRQVLNLKHPEPASKAMQEMANKVEAECPFAKTFGIFGQGEGIVWKAQFPFGGKEKFWVKMKGPITNGTDIPNKKHASKEEFVDAVVSEGRLVQGWKDLADGGFKRNRGDVAKFVSWVREDVKKEKKTDMKALKLTTGDGAQFMMDRFEEIAGTWYLNKCR